MLFFSILYVMLCYAVYIKICFFLTSRMLCLMLFAFMVHETENMLKCCTDILHKGSEYGKNNTEESVLLLNKETKCLICTHSV